MIVHRKLIFAAAIFTELIFLTPRELNAFELAGAWTTRVNQCEKIFARKGRANRVDFTNFSGVYGTGFIADANFLRSKSDTCSIKSMKEDGQNINLVVMCASGVLLRSVQFFLKVVDEDTISREFPGMEGKEETYYRCRI